jgi:hypothetical protein
MVIKQGRNKSKMNLIGTLEIREEYGICPFCFGGGAPTCKMTPICKPTSTSNPKTQQIIRFAGWVVMLKSITTHGEAELQKFRHKTKFHHSSIWIRGICPTHKLVFQSAFILHPESI